MKMLQTVKDKYDILGVTSIIGIILGISFTIVAFVLTICTKIATPSTDVVAVENAKMYFEISLNSSKILLFSGFLGSILYQLLNYKKRDDFALWFVLIWFEVSAALAAFVLYFPSVYIILMNLIFKA